MKKKPRWVRIRSKNHTAKPLRRSIPSNGKNVILRLGSGTLTEQITKLPVDLEINTSEACILSNNKKKMKEAFNVHDVKTAEWSPMNLVEASINDEDEWPYFPAIIKHVHSSQGNGIYYIRDREELLDFISNNVNSLLSYIIEKYYTYVKEYRLHVDADGCFYASRKMLKRDAEERWHRHDNNSVWILPENELFDKPENWEEIVQESIKAMNAIGLDMCAIDIKTQSKRNPDFIILETNSGPSLGEIGVSLYIERIKNKLQ